ncbi:hypothetical protein bcere0010_23500 [Bacillus cereus ATCC 4342]|nr:hypothetical protein bcere0010_23500 [Bacillus cereus ATCC 4342]
MLKLRNWIFYYFYVPHTMFFYKGKNYGKRRDGKLKRINS